ncbi:MAG: chondroitinase-B domain-containing protein [Chitinophagaceae bacterium]
MKRLLLLTSLFVTCLAGQATTIPVKDIAELNAANKQAKPGDIIILRDGEWKDVIIQLDCKGSAEKPILFKAATAGKVWITGHSQLKLGGSYLIVDGLSFTNGYAGDDAVIEFRTSKEKLANHCRVTNCAVDDFNNPKRMDENNWVLFYGKNNRLDHSSFRDKKNMGVLLAVILDDDRSRENFHSIDHNYFGRRSPLGSNGGEIIRVGVSQHCQFNSNTQITDNFFEYCDGETEIVSIKSGSNTIRNNLFKESQGSVVLRHGDNNTAENNIFLGNGKEATGGVRVINKGQWVVNNLFYKCRGTGFRSPLAIMNGIPNSPAHRYVQVTEAVIANNSFYNCSPAAFCEGSDTERTLPPVNVFLLNNTFYNTSDGLVYKTFDNTDGFVFGGNTVNKELKQAVANGFARTALVAPLTAGTALPRPAAAVIHSISDSLQQAAHTRLGHVLSAKPYFSDAALLNRIRNNAVNNCGAGWFKRTADATPIAAIRVSCSNAEALYQQLERKEPVIIVLTGNHYSLTRPLLVTKNVRITGKRTIQFSTTELFSVFNIGGKGALVLDNLVIDGKGINASHFISSDPGGHSDHYHFSIRNCTIRNIGQSTSFFHAAKSMIADSIVIRNNSFINNAGSWLLLNEEKDNKGYYNAERIVISSNRFESQQGILIDIYRGGNDESTLGPKLFFANNTVTNCNAGDNNGLIRLTGVQYSSLTGNRFSGCAPAGLLIVYSDAVRADHQLRNNQFVSSGTIRKNKFVTEQP